MLLFLVQFGIYSLIGESLSSFEIGCSVYIILSNSNGLFPLKFTNNLVNHRCDVFDYLILENCKKDQFINVISDDGDFFSIDKIQLFTTKSPLPDIVGV